MLMHIVDAQYRLRFYRAMIRIRGTSHGPVSVCPSVTSRCSAKTAERRITQTAPHSDSSFLTPKISAKFDRGHPLRGRQMQVGWVKIDNGRVVYITSCIPTTCCGEIF